MRQKAPEKRQEEEQYMLLIKSGYFNNVNVSKYGYGTFLRNEQRQMPENPLHIALKLKKTGDSVYENNRDCAYRMWIEAFLLYLQGAPRDERSVAELVTYLKSVINLAVESSNRTALHLLQTSLLSLEYEVEKLRTPSNRTAENIDEIIERSYLERTPLIPLKMLPAYVLEKLDGVYYN